MIRGGGGHDFYKGSKPQYFYHAAQNLYKGSKPQYFYHAARSLYKGSKPQHFYHATQEKIYKAHLMLHGKVLNVFYKNYIFSSSVVFTRGHVGRHRS